MCLRPLLSSSATATVRILDQEFTSIITPIYAPLNTFGIGDFSSRQPLPMEIEESTNVRAATSSSYSDSQPSSSLALLDTQSEIVHQPDMSTGSLLPPTTTDFTALWAQFLKIQTFPPPPPPSQP